MKPIRVDKPWGHELIWAKTDRYVGKILHIKAGHALSLQYHERKDETVFLLSGRMRFQTGESEKVSVVAVRGSRSAITAARPAWR